MTHKMQGVKKMFWFQQFKVESSLHAHHSAVMALNKSFFLIGRPVIKI